MKVYLEEKESTENRSIALKALLCFALAFFLGCGQSGEKRVLVKLSGSSTMGPMINEIGKRYSERKSGVRVDVQTGGSSRGIADAGNGLADVGMSSRDLTIKEKSLYQETIVATDGIGFLVNSANPVQELTKDQLGSIFTGEISDWKDLGGKPGKIVFINRAAGRSELSIVSKIFGIKADKFKPSSIAGENQQGIKLVAGNPNAITYMSVGASLFAAEKKEAVKLLPFQGVTPDFRTVASGEYSLSRPLILVTKGETKPWVKDFIDFCRSKEMNSVVKDFSYVPVQN